MDKASSLIAAFNAGKLPTTEQFNAFVAYLNDVGITNVEPTNDGTQLSAQGRTLANDLRGVLDAYKGLANNKNGDNTLQEALWHISQGDLTTTQEAEDTKNQAISDLSAIRSSLRTILSLTWSSYTDESQALFGDFMSVLRTTLADAAEVVESQAASAKEGLRSVESEVQDGKRDTLGRDKQRLEEEKDPKVAWQHGMDTVKDAGTTVIGGAQGATESVKDKKDRTSDRLSNAYNTIWERAQSNPEYRKALDTLFTILHDRLDSIIDAFSDPNTTLSSFVADTTPEQHIPKAIEGLRTVFERLAGTSLEPLIKSFRSAANEIARDPELKAWFNDFFAFGKKCLGEEGPGYLSSDEAKAKRKELRIRWRTLIEKDQSGKWGSAVENVKKEWANIEQGLRNDGDLNNLKEAHVRLGEDLKNGLMEVKGRVEDKAEEVAAEVKPGLQEAIDQATWFWRDLFTVWVPKALEKMKGFPIPRTEYKDNDVEFVLENLDVSALNILPSHVYIRNITDVDITTSAGPEASKTRFGALTHIQIQAAQLQLKDISFWFLDKQATIGPSEFSGLLALTLPPKGLDIDLKVRLIPTTHTNERLEKKRFYVIETSSVSISEGLKVEVRESNHSVLATLFQGVVQARVKAILEKALGEQLRAGVDWLDGFVWDVSERSQVFKDAGIGGGASFIGALMSEVGKLERERAESGVGWTARGTGTGVVLEQQVKGKQSVQIAMGAEPQILSGEKRGPMGTGSEPVKDKVARIGEQLGEQVGVRSDSRMSVDAPEYARQVAGDVKDKVGEVVGEGKRQVDSFKSAVERKSELEKGREGWKSAAFDF